MKTAFVTEVHIALRSTEEVELYNGFLAALQHLRETGSLPAVGDAQPQKRVKLTEDDLTPHAVEEIVREHTRAFGSEQTLAALHGIGARSMREVLSNTNGLAWRVYDHLFNRLQEKGA